MSHFSEMFPGRSSHQPLFQSTFSNAAHRSGPPPAKKSKGNPVITRYPPPPGYHGPLQSQTPYQGPSWSQGGSGSYSTFAQQSYGGPQAYWQPSWLAGQQPPQQQQPIIGYGVSTPHGFLPISTQVYQNVGPNPPTTIACPQSAPPRPTFQVPSMSPYKTHRQNSSPFSVNQTSSGILLDGNGDPLPPAHLEKSTGDGLEHEFDSECYFARHPDEINSELSLGQIVWSAPQSTRRALPGIFAEAELEAIAPRPPFSTNEESVSEYFVRDKREEVLLNVRQTDAWENVKSDLIFKEFPRMSRDTLPRRVLVEKFRRRQGSDRAYFNGMQATDPIPETSRSNSPAIKVEPSIEQHDSVIEIDYDHDDAHLSVSKDEQDDVLGSLEQAIYSTEPHQPYHIQASNDANHARTHARAHSRSHSRHHSRSHSRSYSRASSVYSAAGQHISRPVPLPPLHDQKQEEILAALGVTGEARLVYQTPGPAFGPPAGQSQGGAISHNRRGSTMSSHGASQVALSTQALQFPSHDPWNLNQYGYSHHLYQSTASVYSQQTAAGFDFQIDDSDITPRPPIGRMDSRKRGYDNDDHGLDESCEPTPKPKKGKTLLRTEPTIE